MVRSIRDNGVNVMIVEQNTEGALSISDTALVLELGRKVLEAPAREVRDDPRITKRIWVRRSPALSKAPDRRRCAAQIASGSQTPFSLAHRRAVSYPASAWRITPVAGSFQSTRAIFSAASGVPSASRAIPECWE